eukprot:Pompholyxophrys_punicea_v1_NODE_798_length_1278_cov_4.151267.p2 type:complete len:147 gc:universal NODE_798_length_1278_cov_4.151267:575-135(-)
MWFVPHVCRSTKNLVEISWSFVIFCSHYRICIICCLRWSSYSSRSWFWFNTYHRFRRLLFAGFVSRFTLLRRRLYFRSVCLCQCCSCRGMAHSLTIFRCLSHHQLSPCTLSHLCCNDRLHCTWFWWRNCDDDWDVHSCIFIYNYWA